MKQSTRGERDRSITGTLRLRCRLWADVGIWIGLAPVFLKSKEALLALQEKKEGARRNERKEQVKEGVGERIKRKEKGFRYDEV